MATAPSKIKIDRKQLIFMEEYWRRYHRAANHKERVVVLASVASIYLEEFEGYKQSTISQYSEQIIESAEIAEQLIQMNKHDLRAGEFGPLYAGLTAIYIGFNTFMGKLNGK